MFEDTIQFIYGGPSPMNRNVSSKHYVQNRNSLLKNGSGNNVTNEQKTSREQIKRGASFVVGQKLRESKWFTHEEINVLCAVLESGFIIERQNDSDNIFGIALWAPGFEKSKNPDYITIYSVCINTGHARVHSWRLLDFWPLGTRLRINNYSDKDNPPHNEEIIRDQIAYAENNKQQWHNTQHFTYWCRYGPPQVNYRVKQVSDSVKWGSIGINTALLLLKNKKRRPQNKCGTQN